MKFIGLNIQVDESYFLVCRKSNFVVEVLCRPKEAPYGSLGFFVDLEWLRDNVSGAQLQLYIFYDKNDVQENIKKWGQMLSPPIHRNIFAADVIKVNHAWRTFVAGNDIIEAWRQ